MSKIKLGVILPHTKLYGGVKRFFELGEVFIKKGLEFMVFTPEGIAPTWYKGNVPTLAISEISRFEFEAMFITEVQFLSDLAKANAKRRILYFVRPSDDLMKLNDFPDVEVFANSPNGLEVAKIKFGIEAFKAYGGINTRSYYPKDLQPKTEKDPFTVVVYGRVVEKKKGTRLVVRACEKLFKKGYNMRVVLFDTPVNEKATLAIRKFKADVPFEFILNHPVDRNVELFHKGDIFVAAEKSAGHSNTAAEAMASGLAVIGTNSGTGHFLVDGVTGVVVERSVMAISGAIERLMNDFDLRKKLAENGRKHIEEISWERLAEKILNYLQKPRPERKPLKYSLWGALKVRLNR